MSERQRPVVDDQPRLADVVDDDGAVGELLEWNGPQLAIPGPIEARTTTQTFSGQALVHLDRTKRLVPAERTRESVAKRRVGIWTAETARTMTGRQRNTVVEEEERRPRTRLVERMPPATKAGAARDPEVAAVMAYEIGRRVDETTPIAGEDAALVDRVKVTPRIDAVPTWTHVRRRLGRCS